MTPPPPAGEAVQVYAVRQVGSGTVTTADGSYPLGALTYGRAASGRGVLDLEAGAGRLQLAGGDADEIAPGRWRLRIDRMGLITVRPAHGTCNMVMRPSPPTYVSLSCRVTADGDARPFVVTWRGDGSPAAAP